MVQKAAYGPKNLDYRAIHEPMELAFGQGIVGRVGASGIAEIVSNTAEDVDYVVDDAMRGSEMAVPILCDGEVIGVIDSEHSLEGFFQSYHLRLLQSVANICGQKIGRSIGEERTQEFAKFFQLNPNPVARPILMASFCCPMRRQMPCWRRKVLLRQSFQRTVHFGRSFRRQAPRTLPSRLKSRLVTSGFKWRWPAWVTSPLCTCTRWM